MFNLPKIIFPYRCIMCQLPSDQEMDLCSSCEQRLPWIKNSCVKCGRPMDLKSANLICGNCLLHKPNSEQTVALFTYQEPINHLILKLKFYEKLIYAKILSELLTKKIIEHYKDQTLPELILPVPLHKKRLRERGFNQASELARYTSKKLQIPMDRKSCIRCKPTQAQSSIPAKLRHKNVKNAFTLIHPITANHIAIVDDVITTGSTIKEMTKTLKKSGSKQIDIWCIAKAGPI